MEIEPDGSEGQSKPLIPINQVDFGTRDFRVISKPEGTYDAAFQKIFNQSQQDAPLILNEDEISPSPLSLTAEERDYLTFGSSEFALSTVQREFAERNRRSLLDVTGIIKRFGDRGITVSPDGTFTVTLKPSRQSEFIPDDVLVSLEGVPEPKRTQERAGGNTNQAHRARATRIRESPSMRALLATSRSNPSVWGRVEGFQEKARQGAYTETEAPGMRNRLLSPLFSGLYTATPNAVTLALEGVVAEDNETIANGQSWPTIVLGTGPTGSTYISKRREQAPNERILAMDLRLSGVWGLAEKPLFSVNSRNRATTAESVDPLPGDVGNLNSLSPGVLELSDLDSTVYPTQDIFRKACAFNTVVNSTRTAIGYDMIGLQRNRDKTVSDAYRVVTERAGKLVELTTNRFVLGSGLGSQKYKFEDEATNTFIDTERVSDNPRILTYNDVLQRGGDRTKQFPLIDFKGKRVAVIGGGNSGNTLVEILLNLQVRAGDSVAQVEGPSQIDWWGVDETTKETLCNTLRGRYGLIALNAPRESDPDYFAPLKPINKKAETIAENTDGKLQVTGIGVADQPADIVLIAKGYENRVEEALRGMAQPTDIDGKLVNGNEIVRGQVASSLLPGSYITFETRDGSDIAVELLPGLEGESRLRFYRNAQSFDKTIPDDRRQAALEEVLASGKVKNIEAITEGVESAAFVPPAVGVLAETRVGLDKVVDFVVAQQAAGQELFVFASNGLEQIVGTVDVSNKNGQITVRQQFPIDFMQGNVGTIRNTKFFAESYLSTIDSRRESVLLGLPPEADLNASAVAAVRNAFRKADVGKLIGVICPGFGIALETNTEAQNSYIVTDVTDGQVSYYERRISFRENEPRLITKSLNEFVRSVSSAFDRGADNYPSSIRIVKGTALAQQTETSQPVTVNSEQNLSLIDRLGGERSNDAAEFISDILPKRSEVRAFIAAGQAKGNDIYILRSDEIAVVDSTLPKTGEDQTVELREASTEEFDFFGQESNAIFNARDARELIRETADEEDMTVLSLPKALTPDGEVDALFEARFTEADVSALAPFLKPGFGISLENAESARRVLIITSIKDDRIKFLDSEDLLNVPSNEFVAGNLKVKAFVEFIQEELTEKDASEYGFYVRIPVATAVSTSQAANTPGVATKTPSTDIQSTPVAEKQPIKVQQPITIKASTLILQEQFAPVADETTAVGKSVLGEEIYIIGPAAKLPFSAREADRLNKIGIADNSDAVLRYRPRTVALAARLPQVRGTETSSPAPEKLRLTFVEDRKKPEAASVRTSQNRLAENEATVRLPYDTDLQSTGLFALSAAIRGRVDPADAAKITRARPMVVRARFDGAELVTELESKADAASAEGLLKIVEADPLFTTVFSRLAQSVPKGYATEIAFDLVAGDVNPYTASLRTVRQKKAAGNKA